MATAIVVLAVVLSYLPGSIGTAALGDSWQPTVEVIVRYGVVFGGVYAAFELGGVLRALDQTHQAVWAAVPMFVLSMVATFALTSYGTNPLLIGLTGATWLGVGIYAFQVRAALRQSAQRYLRLSSSSG